MSDLVFFFDGIKITGPINGLEGAEFNEERQQENGRFSRSFTDELQFYEDAFLLIKAKLIDDPNARVNKINVKVYDSCCSDELLFEGILRGDSIDWCEEDCYVTAQIVEETAETKQMDCIKSTLIYDDRSGFQSQNHPRVKYCVEIRPAIYQEVIIILGILLNLILGVFVPVVFVVSLLVQLVCLIPGVNCPEDLEDGILDNYTEWMNRLNSNIIGCGRMHPTPLVRDYIQNVCDICGVGFSSSILNDVSSDYYNLLYYNNPVEKGTKDATKTYIPQNKPIKTLEGLLEDLKLVFNAEYRVIDSVLHFERRDYFFQGVEWLNYETLKAQKKITTNVCYEWRDEERQAAINLQYSPDAADWVGNEALPFYDDIVGQNDPYSSLQSGIKEVVLPFSVPRFRDDLIDADILGAFSSVPFFGNSIKESNGALIQNNGTNFLPKLLIWDGKSRTNAKVRFWPVTSLAERLNVVLNNAYPISRVGYNYVMQFNEYGVSPNTSYDQDEANMGLYGRFYTIDHPKVGADLGLDFSFSFKYSCTDLRNRSIYKGVTLPRGSARISKITINPDRQIMTIYGKL